MARALNFAVVGLGMGGHHCGAIQNAKGANLAAVCDIDEERVAQHVKAFDVKGYTRYEDVLRDPDVDVVSIVTESAYHADMGIKAARAGKHIVMEKPLDVSPAKMKRFKGVVESTGVTCGCVFQHRLDPFHVYIKKAIERGLFGDLIGVHAHLPWFRPQAYYEGPHGKWHGTWSLDGGGSLMNQGIHTLDLAIHFAGPVDRVCAFYNVHAHAIEAEDQTAAVLKFTSGALGTFYSTTCHVPDKPQRLHVFGTKGSFSRSGGILEFFEAGAPKERERIVAQFSGQRKADAAGADPMAIGTDGHVLIFEDMVKAVRAGRAPAITVESAMYSVLVACAIYKSARTGKAVAVEPFLK